MNHSGDTLIKVRSMLKISKREAAEKIGVTPKTYAKYERDGHKDYVRFIRSMGAVVEDTRVIKIWVEDRWPLVLTSKEE